ncbi:Beige protein-like 1 [Sporothrix curviconia]|uniref:Beige protein-like 1 n=1 Tax=Sporothrix curviconia TaxID=1260050 RepID=A0ABP0CCD5_9PEZI
MATRPSRYRSSTSASNKPATTKAAEVLQSLLHGAQAVISPPSSSPSRQQLLPTDQPHAATPPRRRTVGGYPDIQALLKYARQIHQYLTALSPPSTAQDDFRHMHGFQLLLSILRSFSGFYNPQVRSEPEKRALFELLHVTLAVLSAALRGHHGNRRYFRHRVEGGGWEALEQVIASIGLGVSDSDLWGNCQLFGKLLSFALDDQRMDELSQWIAEVSIGHSPSKSKAAARDLPQGEAEEVKTGRGGTGTEAPGNTPKDSESGTETDESDKYASKDESFEHVSKEDAAEEVGGPEDVFDVSHMKKKLGEIIGPKTELQNAQVMRTVIGFWECIPRSQGGNTDPISLLVLDTVSALLRISLANLAALHSTGILSRFLRLYFADKSPLSSDERERILPICQSLMYLGVNQLSDAQFLLSSSDPAASVFCLEMASKYTGPPFVQFDLSHCGHSSIELPNLGRPFPPMAGNGFTFTCWMRIDNFDPRSHTTIFGVFDASQTCFLLLYLERDTRNFILQTSVISSRPSVRFRSVSFREKEWYHVALVHRRGKARASLYVNGEFVEQVKAAYPVPPPTVPTGAAESFVSFGSSNRGKPIPVQAFLGTPKDLSLQVGPGLVFSKWSLASAHLFEETLSDDFIAVHYRLGPRYQANYQDSLGGFQTYTASARLALRNDFNGGKDDNSDILRAIRDKAASIVPEQKILMSTLPRSTFRTDGTFFESLLFRSLSRASAANLLSLTTKSGTAIAINGALPCINDALVRSHGVSILAGDPVLVTPFYFDDNLWRLAGFSSLALKLVERTTTAEELLRATEMVFHCINSSWRNSDAMERDNGYSILSMLLRAKLKTGPQSSLLTLTTSAPFTSESSGWKATPVTGDRQETSLRMLKLVLSFVGYDHANPLESLIINPLAYRILLIDFDTWRKAPPDTQQLYYEQFDTFAVMSKFHQFNSRRLLRMRIIKRLLDAMKVETVSEEILPYFLKSFESLVRCNYNAEVHRALALYITYALHTPPTANLPRTPRPLGAAGRSSASLAGSMPRRHTGESSSGAGGSESSSSLAVAGTAKTLTKKQLGVRILKLYEQLLCEKGTVANIRKFARTVTNKWLLYLLSSDDLDVLLSGCKILTRLLVTQGSSYAQKFGSKSGGFWIMAHRLRHWWDVPTIWLCVFSILFGKDVAAIEAQDSALSLDVLVSAFGAGSKIVCSDILVVVVAVLQQGLGDVLKTSDSSSASPASDGNAAASVPTTVPARGGAGTKSQEKAALLDAVVQFLSNLHVSSAEFRDFTLVSDYLKLLSSALFPAVVSMEALPPEVELNSKDAPLRFDGADIVIRQRPSATPMVRTSSINSSLSSSVHSTIGGSTVDVATDSTILASTESAHPAASRPGPSVNPSANPSANTSSNTRHRRSSSFILLTTQAAPLSWHTAKLAVHSVPKRQLVVIPQQENNGIQDRLMGLIIDAFVDQVLVRKEFPGFNLGQRTPPSFQEHQAYFESSILRSTILRVKAILQRDLRMLCEPKVLTNMARFTAHMVDGTFDGTFVNGVDVLMDFIGMLLEYLHRPEVASLKSVRLCNQAVMSIRASFLKLVLFRLSDVDAEMEGSNGQSPEAEALPVLERIFYWQSVLIDCLSTEITSDEYHMKLMFYQLYARLLDPDESVRLAAASIWRVILVQKPNESATVLRQCATTDQLHLARSFRNLTEVDDGTFLEWVDKHRPSLDAFFLGGMSKFWEDFVTTENQRASDSLKSRLSRRRDKLKQWHGEMQERSNILLRHEMANSAWMKSIFATEHFKLQRVLQDQQDDLTYLATTFGKMERDLKRPGAVFSASGIPTKWKLDRTEGRNRMRLRLLPDSTDRVKIILQAKKKAVEAAAAAAASSTPTSAVSTSNRGATPTPEPAQPALSKMASNASTVSSIPSTATLRPQDTSSSPSGGTTTITSTPTPCAETPAENTANVLSGNTLDGAMQMAGAETGVSPEDDFELIDDPNEPDGEDGFEDKNRKVMRRLEQGDVVQNVYNVSRIIGLDACEGILIVGKDALYLMDNVFQCRDGEIVNAWQAPADERDPFSQIITTKPANSHDKDAATNGIGGVNGQPPSQASNGVEQESRSWRWFDVISVSKRRFLFRDVAIELFFRDGRSYLLTTIDNAKRDDVYGRLMARIPHSTGPANALPNPEDAWRLEALRVSEEVPQTLGSKFGSIFNSSPWSPSMRRWQKGEMSNFHYLMLVNTMAGRTFNDLTQYPVFPWVLADYTSDELDLTNSASFRDLSKPMGAQTTQRQADFAMRYNTLAEMGQPPFHYGTHYSSAMVVSSYLIRLPPFVQSFLLLQGGHFDHPDRLFYSIEGAWRSASHDNGADVRELIPEFFCLPEFLININGYDFGRRQDGSKIDNVVLPPWAKGDPNIFIAKHREALESPYVSQHLHKWIDLVFGNKQRGDAAVESLNVFHHLSYDGAIDLDNIKDPQERAIVTGIIHNFGQTPRQVFSRPHQAREHETCPIRRLDSSAELLARIPHSILESRERVASLVYVQKLDRLLCASPFRLNLPPVYDKYLEWGYTDNSIRFYHSDNRKLAGLFENLHIGQISCVAFADSKTLITAGEDCAVSVYAVVQSGSGKPVELLTRSSLFGHKTPVTTVAVSNAFSTLLTVSQDGVAMLWDLNRLEFIRKLPGARPVECARINDVTGEIMLCSGPNVVLYTLNGELLLDQNVCDGGPEDYVHSCAFYEGAGSEWLENCLVFTGHRRGRVNIWRKTVGPRGRWVLELVRRLDHVDPKSEVGANVDAAITCITPMPQLVYTGDDDGRVLQAEN